MDTKTTTLQLQIDYLYRFDKEDEATTSSSPSSYHIRTSFDTTASMPSPIYTDFQTESPMFRKDSSSSGGDGFLGPAHALDLTTHYVRKQQLQSMPQPSPLAGQAFPLDGNDIEDMKTHDGLIFAERTIRQNMLCCNTGYDIADQLDNIMFGIE
ncbi:hypothetical protein O988_05147 [Pseudogymnoascus sp. VKM F-3808]|nr:hypothetical protein O988_05147 [Pseudogymnoascus sp. VKM F-3808]